MQGVQGGLLGCSKLGRRSCTLCPARRQLKEFDKTALHAFKTLEVKARAQYYIRVTEESEERQRRVPERRVQGTHAESNSSDSAGSGKDRVLGSAALLLADVALSA